MLKAIKLVSKDLKYPLDQLLGNLGAVHHGRAYTGYVFFSADDLKVLRRNYRRTVRAEFPRARKFAIDQKVEQHFQQFSTNTNLGRVLKPGYVVVDYTGISLCIRRDEESARDEAYQVELERQRAAELERQAVVQPTRLQLLAANVKGFFEANFGDPANQAK